MAFGIGANDVANAFATSVSAKSVTLKQAVLIASVCEFLGATLLGASVTSAIKGKILDTSLCEDEPGTLMCGMLTCGGVVHLGGGQLPGAAPVSTTHTINAVPGVGGTISVGFLGGSKNLDPLFILKVILGWVGTFVAVCVINAGVFAFAFYAPSAPGFE